MALGRVLLATKQGDPAVPGTTLQALDPIEKGLGSLDALIVYPTVRIVELLRCGPSPKLEAEEQTADTVVRQDSFEVSGTEVWRVPRVRL
jgi:hypothetical protein